jgi:hypothetical protein
MGPAACATDRNVRAPECGTVKGAGLTVAMLLAGCGMTPVHVEQTPNVCPALPETPAQVATILPDTLPNLPDGLTPDQAAGALLRVRVDSAAQYQACIANNAALADWVRHHSQP